MIFISVICKNKETKEFLNSPIISSFKEGGNISQNG